MNKKVKIGIVIVAIMFVAAITIYVLTMPPSGLSIQASWTVDTVFGLGTLHYEATVFNHYNTTVHSANLELRL